MMKLTLTLQKGEQHLIYVSRSRKFPDAIKNYRVNVKKVEGDIATIIDLDDKDKEKTFYIYKVLEVLEIESSETDVNERLNWHRDNFFETYKPLKSFKLSKGLPLMKKKCSASIAGDTLKITIGNYPANLNRDIHFFSFLCAALKDMEIDDKNRFNLSDCKSWNDFAIAMFPEEFGEYENFFKDEFDVDMKNYYLEQFKEEVESYNEDQLKPPTANPARMQFLSALREAFLNTDFDTSSFISEHGMSMSFQILIENDKIIQVK